MIFNVSPFTLVNILFIAAGIGICFLSFLQVTASTHLRKEIRRCFQAFFLLIIVYISTHLARELMNGLPGGGIRAALYVVTFVEVLAAGFMAYMMSMLVLAVSNQVKNLKRLEKVLLILLIVHAVILFISQFFNLVYYFDANNVYARAPGYLLSNLAPMVMLLIDAYLLIRYRDQMERRVRTAFWVYIIAPIVAMGIQSFSYGIQFIILATVCAAVYMFEVIIRDQTDKFEKQQVEASRLDTELSMATRIQADMLPNIFPAFPERDEFDVHASMTPAKEVGGDFYDFFLIDNYHLGLAVADVSGKGVPAALFMMISKILVQNYALTGRTPKEVLESVNDQICKNNREEMFVTVWFGILDLKNGKLTAANAGHEYPAVKHPDGSFELIKDKHGFVIGGMEGMMYSEYELTLEPGSKLFLYTDGVAEAENADHIQFGTDRMIEALRSAENGTPEDLINAVHDAVNSFVQEAPQFDDLTMLCLQYDGPEQNTASDS